MILPRSVRNNESEACCSAKHKTADKGLGTSTEHGDLPAARLNGAF
jgi:hypothetical protein